jgi:predicted choloylglycine hydrolase
VRELDALASRLAMPRERLFLANLYYDAFRVVLGCTAIAVDDPDGPLHARNLDWWSPARLLATATWVVRYEGASAGPFEVVGWPGFVGAFSGVARGRFAVSMNAVAAVSEKPRIGGSVPMVIRETLERARDFDDAVLRLSSAPLTADCLLMVTGTRAGELVVIERTSTRAELRTAENGLLVATNDYRAMPGEVAMDGSGSLAQTADGRYRRALSLCLAHAPKDATAALAILADDKVGMDMTVQQMVFRAATGEAVVRDPKERSADA